MHSAPRRLTAGLLLVPLLSGCFASAGDGTPGSGDGARLRVALAFPPSQRLSPYGQDAFILSRLGVTEGLTLLDGNGAAVPALAETWSGDPDGRGWSFTLREARFQDGTTVTPAAVAAALTHAAQAEPAPSALSGVKLTATAQGDRHVRITTAEPDPVLPQRLSNPSLAVFSPKAYAKQGTVDPVGTATGPFTLTKVTGTTGATLDRFGGYWGGSAQAAGIDARFVADGTSRANALRSGATDLAEAIPIAQIASLSRGTVRETATARNTALFLNTRSGPFKDPALRAAARSAIDTSALAENVYEGHADPAVGLFGPAVTWAAGKRVQPSRTGRPASADGASITLATYDNRPELPEVAQVAQERLERAGFTVKLVVRDYSRLEGDALGGSFDAVIAARNMMLDTGDPASVLAADFTCGGSFNLARLCDKDVDRAVAMATAAGGTTERQGAVMRAESAILATDAVVPLVHQKTIVGVGTSVRGAITDPYERLLVGPGTRR